MDVFNALNQMENESFLKDLKFGSGDGSLHYYLFNWKCATFHPKNVSNILLFFYKNLPCFLFTGWRRLAISFVP